jgi:hypothetical protein
MFLGTLYNWVRPHVGAAQPGAPQLGAAPTGCGCKRLRLQVGAPKLGVAANGCGCKRLRPQVDAATIGCGNLIFLYQNIEDE